MDGATRVAHRVVASRRRAERRPREHHPGRQADQDSEAGHEPHPRVRARQPAGEGRWGVGGLTVACAEGDPFGSRVGDIQGAFLRLECVVGEATAERALHGLAAAYLERFKVAAYDHPVRVVRGATYP